MMILSGRDVAKHRKAQLKDKISRLKQQQGVAPGLAVLLVGDDPASQVYVRNKVKSCQEVGMVSYEFRLSSSTPADELKRQIVELNNNSKVHGILLQLPLPKQLNENEILSWIDPRKDPDALTIENQGLLWAGRPRVKSCTPNGVMAILEHFKLPVAGQHAVVVGRSHIVGRPMAQLLQMADATVTVCHSKTKDLKKFTREADIVVVAAGRPRFLGKDDFKKDAVVIDVGIHRLPQPSGLPQLCGDVRFEELEGWVKAATPVPGGVGPMTITMLLENTVKLTEDAL